jgi:hypothetical protein
MDDGFLSFDNITLPVIKSTGSRVFRIKHPFNYSRSGHIFCSSNLLYHAIGSSIVVLDHRSNCLLDYAFHSNFLLDRASLNNCLLDRASHSNCLLDHMSFSKCLLDHMYLWITFQWIINLPDYVSSSNNVYRIIRIVVTESTGSCVQWLQCLPDHTSSGNRVYRIMRSEVTESTGPCVQW